MAADSGLQTTAMTAASVPAPAVTPVPVSVEKKGQNYKGFVAGVFSGVAKLTGEFQSVVQRRLSIRLRCPYRTSASFHNFHVALTNLPSSRPPLRHNKSPPTNL